VGTTWYTWLEQGRDIHASDEVLDAIARTLQLDADEQAYLQALANHRDPAIPLRETVSPGLRRVVENQGLALAYIVGRRWDHLAWNRTAAAVDP